MSSRCSSTVFGCFSTRRNSTFHYSTGDRGALHCNRGPRRGKCFCKGLSRVFSRVRKGRVSCGGLLSVGTTISLVSRFSSIAFTVLGRGGTYKLTSHPAMLRT